MQSAAFTCTTVFQEVEGKATVVFKMDTANLELMKNLLSSFRDRMLRVMNVDEEEQLQTEMVRCQAVILSCVCVCVCEGSLRWYTRLDLLQRVAFKRMDVSRAP